MNFEIENLKNLSPAEEQALKISFAGLVFRSEVSSRVYPFSADQLVKEAGLVRGKQEGLTLEQAFDLAARANWDKGSSRINRDSASGSPIPVDAELIDGPKL